ncbi:hypothetical protein SKA58_10083 [Sphingomonas sp. SKA58]|uniref:hypothetical protein n=1 Tax=Sphingomonas sp. (strain SKA58) TaxID=314266 RepID=UPI0000D7B543|nr:hypothetical protein [Sphingomonas sp. SKA58]EAT07006.1 hypothetical protein SKA58_10083 [Sphingomonas sp. SKA58]
MPAIIDPMELCLGMIVVGPAATEIVDYPIENKGFFCGNCDHARNYARREIRLQKYQYSPIFTIT